ncbi:MAG TPA: hypothetical protein VHE35_21500 [Kofleriaceae bacterium]|nr:hypothetical protein [Kofleriaceae bacterium]
MLRWLAALALAASLAAGSTSPAAAGPDPVPVPRGSRLAGDRHASALGFRATADWYEKLWRTTGVVVKTVGPYRVAGVDVIRYLRDDGPWRAVHVYRLAGTTWISVVLAPAPAAPSPAATAAPPTVPLAPTVPTATAPTVPTAAAPTVRTPTVAAAAPAPPTIAPGSPPASPP